MYVCVCIYKVLYLELYFNKECLLNPTLYVISKVAFFFLTLLKKFWTSVTNSFIPLTTLILSLYISLNFLLSYVNACSVLNMGILCSNTFIPKSIYLSIYHLSICVCIYTHKIRRTLTGKNMIYLIRMLIRYLEYI